MNLLLELKLSKSFDGCSGEFVVASVKQWFDDKFIVRGDKSLISDGCQYAVLDTVARTVTYKRLDENLKWIQKCDDVRAWGEDVYCLKFDKEERTSSLFINDNLVYRLENDYFWTAGAVLKFQGRIFLLEHDVCRFENGVVNCFASASFDEVMFKNRDADGCIVY